MSHTMNQGEPTLLLFTLGAKREQRRRSLLPQAVAPEEVALHKACLMSALEAGRANACRLRVCSPASLDLPAGCERLAQPGQDFGERLRSAMARARGGSSGPLVVVGSDVPELRSAHVKEALSLLAGASRRVVLGPSPDGGVYLLAAEGPIEELFGEVRWRSRATRRSLVGVLQAAGWEVVLLRPLRDLDRRSDLQSWLANISNSAVGRVLNLLARRLRAALAALRRPAPGEGPPVPVVLLGTAVSGRAPPG